MNDTLATDKPNGTAPAVPDYLATPEEEAAAKARLEAQQKRDAAIADADDFDDLAEDEPTTSAASDAPAPSGGPIALPPIQRPAAEPQEDDDVDEEEEAAKGPYASAEDALAALKVARRAAPRKKEDQPAVAFVVILFDPDHQRISFAARDGRRWHQTFVSASHPIRHPTIAIQLASAQKLAKALKFAVEVFPRGANLRFPSATVAEISYGEEEPTRIELHPFEGGAVDGWRPPRFVAGAGASIPDFEAKCISDATTWPGGGATMRRDEVDTHGRRHITLTDGSGGELLRAVVVPLGLTDGLPDSPQQEIPGALTPAAGPAKAPKASGPKRGKAKAASKPTPAPKPAKGRKPGLPKHVGKRGRGRR